MSNVLVYSGPGVSASALSHTLRTLRRLLPSYDVQCINAQSLALDPWMESTSLVVLPGGRDLPYMASLAEMHHPTSSSFSSFSSDKRATTSSSVPLQAQRADQRIREYVEQHAGAFIGICAGAYFASSSCEFERGDPIMQVLGPRPALQFYPGPCSGTVFPGFVYESDQGARLVDVRINGAANAHVWTTYYNGGGAFIDADMYAAQGVEILGRYEEEDKAPTAGAAEGKHSIKPGYAGQAAIVRCRPGNGHAILYGTHPEFPLSAQSRPTQNTAAPEVLPDGQSLALLEEQRMQHFARHLQQLGLQVQMPQTATQRSSEYATQTNDDTDQLRLTPLVLSTRFAEQASAIVDALRSISTDVAKTQSLDHVPTSGYVLSVADTNDTLHVYDGTSSSDLASACATADYSRFLSPIIAPTSEEARAGQKDEPGLEVDLHKVPKYMVIASAATSAVLDGRLLPHWNISDFVRSIDEARNSVDKLTEEAWASCASLGGFSSGAMVGGSDGVRMSDVHTYGHVVTSTQTMLDKNFRLLTHLPSGFTSFATHQVSGRGRGKNAWISPLGCLQFSTLLRIPSPQRVFWHAGVGSVVFVQYLAGLAIVESVRCGALGGAYARALGDKLRIKWPNDVYAQVEDEQSSDAQQQLGKDNGKITSKIERKGTFVWRGKRYAKMAGVLVNSQFAGSSELALVVGCGINTLNARPTTSLSDLIDAYNATSTEERLPIVSQEQFAGAILATFERMWNTFVNAGGSFSPFIEAYRRAWLHSDQRTKLTDTSPPTIARIVGITSDYGLLRCVAVNGDHDDFTAVTSRTPASWGATNAPGAQWIDLQPDGNSFDMLQNLIRRKE